MICGNNASGLVLSPKQTLTMLTAKHGQNVMARYYQSNQAISDASCSNDKAACHGQETIRYNFGEAVMDENSITMTQDSLRLSEFEQEIDLNTVNPYSDYG